MLTEMYAMMIYRNLFNSPVRRLLEPYLFGTIFICRSIIHPKADGVVTLAYAVGVKVRKLTVQVEKLLGPMGIYYGAYQGIALAKEA